MAGKPWTETELKALRDTVHLPYPEGYHEFGLLTQYSRSLAAWEVKRRTIIHNDPAVQRAEVALREDRESADNRNKELNTRFEERETPELMSSNGLPPQTTKNKYGFSIVFFDIEATSLKGNFGRMLCASGVESDGEPVTFRADDPQYAGTKLRDDSRLVVAFRNYLQQFDIIVGWNSKGYDIPFLNTRLLIAGERPWNPGWQIDLMWKAKKFSLALHSARLDAVAKTFRTPNQKTDIEFDMWLDAALHEKEAMDYVVDHCEKDVLVLREVFSHLKPLVREIRR